MSKTYPVVMAFRLTREDVKEFEKFKKTLFPACGKLTDAQAFRIAIRKLNSDKTPVVLDGEIVAK